LDAPVERARDLLTGPLLRHAQLRDGVEGLTTVTKRGADVRSLVLREQTDDYAVCDLDAEVTYDVGAGSGSTSSLQVTGPVVLARTPAGWKIADYVAGGRRMLESTRLFDEGPPLELPGLAIAPVALGLRALGTALLFDVTNRGSDDLEVRGVAPPSGGLTRTRWSTLDGRRRIAPDATSRIEAQAEVVFPVSTPALRFAIPVRHDNGRVRVVRVDVPFAKRDAAPHARARTLRGLRPRWAWAINAVVALVILVFLGLPDWFR